MAAGKLLILGVAIATTLVVVAQATELGGSNQMCPRIWPASCEQYLMRQGSQYGGRRPRRWGGESEEEMMDYCCNQLMVLRSPECQCRVMEMMSRRPGVDREFAMELPMRCGTMQESCSSMMPYM